MSRKKIYSTELKLKIIREYLNGNLGYKQLAIKYHIGSAVDVRKWVALYQKHGIEGLDKRSRTYTGDFKVSVVEYMHNTGTSLFETAAHFNIPSKDSIKRWEYIYYEEGKEALYKERRGRVIKMGTEKPIKPKNDIQKKEELIAEVQQLRMENEYLKKLNALIQEREKFEKPTRQLS